MKAVVLARGLGRRMREADPAAPLSDAQRRAADAGIKMMIPLHGRPFLDYVLGALADAGVADVALVVAPDHAGIRDHYAEHPPSRVSLSYVVQPEALGTANAVLAVEAWTGGAPFLVMNADNLYPVPALRALAALAEPGLPAFEREDLVRTSNIPAERVLAFALVEIDDEGYLTRIVEKPTDLPPGTDLPPKGGSHENPTGRPAASTSIADPVLPTSDPVLSTSDPVLRTSDPVLPTSDPVLPTSDPVLPTSDPVLPTSDPVLSTSDPVLSTSDPVTSSSDPVLPTSDPVLPTSDPVTSSSNPVLPTSDPVLPTSDPVTSSSNPVASISNPVASAFRRKEQLISMNCWRFDARIFDACRDVPRSARGEFELPEAVGLAAARGVRFKAIPARGPVLDLSRRADAADVERRLAGLEPRP